MVEIKVPEFGESILEGTISQWLKNEGDAVSVGDALVELETDKVNVEVTADEAGVLAKILKQPGETVQVGEVIALLEDSGQPAQPQTGGETNLQPQAQTEEKRDETAAPHKIEEKNPQTGAQQEVLASPAARKLARERGLDLNGTDPIGRITKQDVLRLTQEPPALPRQENAANAPRETAVQPGAGDTEKPVERIRMSRRRQTIAKRLVQAQQTAAMLTTFNEVDMTAILDVRKRHKDAFYENYNTRLGFMSFFTKAVVGALKAFPLLNAEIDGEDILLKKYYDIGVAVSTDEGLVVPVVRNADRMSFAEIEREIASLAEKARNQKLTLADLQGGTFTITNGGVFGSLLSTPILNSPQVGILGMHKIQNRPVATGEHSMENRPMMYIALSYDHRIIDGSEAVRFLVKVKAMLEDPERLLLEG